MPQEVRVRARVGAGARARVNPDSDPDPDPDPSHVTTTAVRQLLGSSRGSGLSPWECRAAQSHQARPEEAREPSWGAAKGHRNAQGHRPEAPPRGTAQGHRGGKEAH